MKRRVLFIEDPFVTTLTPKNRKVLIEQFECSFPYVPIPNIDALLKKYDDKNLIDPRELSDAASRPIRGYCEAIQEFDPDVVVAEGLGCYFLLSLLFDKSWAGATVFLSPTNIDQYNLEGDLDIPPIVFVCDSKDQKCTAEISTIAEGSQGSIMWTNSNQDITLKGNPHILLNSILTAYDLEREAI